MRSVELGRWHITVDWPRVLVGYRYRTGVAMNGQRSAFYRASRLGLVLRHPIQQWRYLHGGVQ